MASSDPYSPVTTSRQIDTPNAYRIYTTTRKVASEFPIPAEGSALTSSNFIGGFDSVESPHYIMQVDERPEQNGKVVTVTHGPIPAGSFVEYESLAYTFPAIYPTVGSSFFPGGSRQRQRVVPATVTYEYRTAPGDWLTAAVVWDGTTPSTGPFEIESVLMQAAAVNFIDGDGASGLVGDYLNPAFITQDTLNDDVMIYSPGSLSYFIGRSIPSVATYAGWVTAKTLIMPSRTIHRWYCFYMRRTVQVVAQ